jgi:hypothetical protein
MWKIDPKDKHIHKKQTILYKNLHVEHIYNSGTILWNSRGGGKGKENDGASMISEYRTSVQAEYMKICV